MSEICLRVFVSSPSDVAAERDRVAMVADRLNGAFEGLARIEVARWEDGFYTAAHSFQEQIDAAVSGMHDIDMVLCILWSRIGLKLNPALWRRPDGTGYESGTVLEYETAVTVSQEKGAPDVYLFRKTAPVFYQAETAAEDMAQHAQLETVWKRWTQTSEGHNLAAYQSFPDPDRFEQQIENCFRQWLDRHGAVVKELVWERKVQGSPFCGLAPFEADHADVFFGREAAVQRAIGKLRDGPFLLLIGASGSGKSSLLRAGLVPRITRPGIIPEIDLWRTAVVLPTLDPLASLADALCADSALGAEFGESDFTPPLLAELMATDAESAIDAIRDALASAARQRAAQRRYETPRPARVLLAIDQMERLFVEADPARVEIFANLLGEMVEQNLAVVVGALRSDTYPSFQRIDALVALRERGAIQDLLPPSTHELEDMVTKPVAICQPPLVFELNASGRSLAKVLVDDAKGGDALPLLQMTLERLFQGEAGRGDGVLRFSDYPGMDEAVKQAAGEAFVTLDEAARAALPALLTTLIRDLTPDPASGKLALTIVPLIRAEFERGQPARTALVDAFIAHRLLTTEESEGTVRVRPVHEALLRVWPEAVRIVTESEALIRVRRTLEPMVADWVRAEPRAKADYLVTSPALLAGAGQLVQRLGADVAPDMQAFITESVVAEADRREVERHRHSTVLAAIGPMTLRSSFVYGALVVVLLAAATIVRYLDPLFVQTLRLATFDTYQRIVPAAYDPNLPVRVVDIDEESLKKVGQWPWSRTTMRDLLQVLSSSGAATVAFDILFSEPDRTSLEEIIKRLPADQAALLEGAGATHPTNDEAFAATLKEAPSVLGTSLTNDVKTNFGPKAGFAHAGDDPKPALPAFAGASGVLPILAEAAQGLGAVNWVPDRDHVVRRAHLFYRVGDDLAPSLAAEALRVAMGASTYLLKSSNASGQTAFGKFTGLNGVRIGDAEMPTEPDGSIALRFRPSDPKVFIPAWKLLAGEISPQEIAGRIVFVGSSAPGLHDIRPTPLQTAVPAVEVHAQLIENILAGRQLTRPDYALGLEEFVIVACGLVLAVLYPRFSPRVFALVALDIVAAILLGGWLAFIYWQILLDPLYPILALGFFTTIIALFMHWQMEARRRAMRAVFASAAGTGGTIDHPQGR